MSLDLEIAPEGKLFVCLKCGKRSRDIYGDKSLNWGWDMSCSMNAELFDEEKLLIGKDNLVKEIIKE